MRGVYILAVVVASLFISLGDLASQTNTATAQKRFLFIVETSDASKSGAVNAQKLLTTLIESGMGGLMEKNDTFGMWTFNEKLYAGQVPMQRWDPASAPETAKRLAEFIKNQKFDKDPQMEPVILPMLSLIRSSPILTVVLVTSGKKPIQGTPFDREINEFYKANYRDYQKQKTPFVTMLLAQRGEVRRHSVSPAVGDVKIPKPLPMPEPVVAQIPPALPQPITAPAPVETPVTALPPKALVITKSGAKTFEGTDAIALAQAEEPLKSITTTPTPTQITTNVAAEPTPAPTPAAIPTPEANAVVQTNQPVTEPTPPPAAPAPAAVAQEEKKPSDTNTTATTTAAVPETPPTVPPVASPPAPAPTPVAAAPAQTAPIVSTSTATNAALTAAVTEQKAEVPPPAAPVTPKAELPVPPTTPTAPTVQTPPPVAAETPPTPSVAAPAPPTPVPAPQLATSNSKTYLIIGFALVIIAVITAFLIGRQTGRKPDRSLITDWANRQK